MPMHNLYHSCAEFKSTATGYNTHVLHMLVSIEIHNHSSSDAINMFKHELYVLLHV